MKCFQMLLFLLGITFFVFSCSKDNSAPDPELALSVESLAFGNAAETKSFRIQTNVTWNISVPDNWCTVSPTSGNNTGNIEIEVAVAANSSVNARNTVLTVNAGKLSKQVAVNQEGNINFDQNGVSSNAAALAAKMTIGWNVGNSLEATSTASASETMWGNPKISKRLIDSVKAAGFNSIRIPCAWNGYIEDRTTYKIKDSWLARVKEVVDYVVGNDMYAILNIHWDGGWLEENPTYAEQEAVNKQQKALWEQIAAYFRDYDEHLLFAGTNEVHTADYKAPSTENSTVQMSYNQTFIDAVRATGGRNTWRNLIVQAYNTNINYAVQYLKMPADIVPNRLMVEIHYYDPWDFCGDTESNKYLWGKDFSGQTGISTWGQENYADEQFNKMKTNFIDKGIPVILGEYGAIYRSSLTEQALSKHIASRIYYLRYVTKSAKEKGIIPFYWDNGAAGNNGFGLFNRNTGAQVYPEAIEAIMSGI